jgi:hypothetical protein
VWLQVLPFTDKSDGQSKVIGLFEIPSIGQCLIHRCSGSAELGHANARSFCAVHFVDKESRKSPAQSRHLSNVDAGTPREKKAINRPSLRG